MSVHIIIILCYNFATADDIRLKRSFAFSFLSIFLIKKCIYIYYYDYQREVIFLN